MLRLSRPGSARGAAALPCLSLAALLGVSGCGSSSDEGSELSGLWPNQDGNRWVYRYDSYESGDSIPPALAGLDPDEASSLDYRDLMRRLELRLPSPRPGGFEQRGELVLEFDGLVQTPDGMKQNLRGTFTEEGKRVSSMRADPIASRLFRARSDLREKLAAAGLVPTDFDAAEDAWGAGPVNTWGGHFELQEEWMGYYGDAISDSSYTILRAPVRRGSSFRHALGGGIASGLIEYGWVGPLRTFETEWGAMPVREVVYFIDFGSSLVIDEGGAVIDTTRGFSIIQTMFAPDVGPVYEREIADFGVGSGNYGPVFCYETVLLDHGP